MAHPHNSRSTLRIFSKFCRMKNWNNWIFQAFWPFFTVWLAMIKLGKATITWIVKQSLLDLQTVTTWLGFLNTEDMISQVNIYVMDVAWILCDVFVEVKILCYCKASLRICYVSLLECKGPLMLKTVINCHVWNRRLQN